MRKVRKKEKVIQAYRLGDDHKVLRQLMEEGKIAWHEDGRYEIFSQEAVNGTGQIAFAGDYIKVDSSGSPYPNDAEFFLSHHHSLGGDDYKEIQEIRQAWKKEDGMCEEIEYLKREKDLVIDETNSEKYFNAPLWGCQESAPSDAWILFYKIERDSDGTIKDIEFNFVAREEQKNYMEL